MEMPIIDPSALRRAYRNRTLTLSDTVAHRRNINGSTAIELCYICLEGWEIGEEVVTLRCEYTHWTYEAYLAKLVFKTSRYPTY